LELSEAEAERIEQMYKSCHKAKDLKRLQLVCLALKGLYTREELAEHTGLSRTRVQELLVKARKGGLDGLLEGRKPGKSYSSLQEPEVQEAMKARWTPARSALPGICNATWNRSTASCARPRACTSG
jgi:hypothetical protein